MKIRGVDGYLNSNYSLIKGIMYKEKNKYHKESKKMRKRKQENKMAHTESLFLDRIDYMNHKHNSERKN